MNRRRRAPGFTLIEVLVALAILATALAAATAGSSTYVQNQISLRDKVFAHWVARNRLTLLQVEGAWPRPGDSNGREDYAGRGWAWRMEISDTEDPDLRRVEISVATADRPAQTLIRLSGFLGNAGQGGAGPGLGG